MICINAYNTIVLRTYAGADTHTNRDDNKCDTVFHRGITTSSEYTHINEDAWVSKWKDSKKKRDFTRTCVLSADFAKINL